MSRQKGNRRERQAAELYESAGWDVHRFSGNRWSGKDAFGLFDLMAVKRDESPRLVQVKSGIREMRTWMDEARSFYSRGCVPEYLEIHDYEGWRLLRPERDGDGWIVEIDEREADCRIGEWVEGFLS